MSCVAERADQIGLSPAHLLVAIVEHEQQAAVLALAVSHVEAGGEWALDGSVSMRAWLRDRGRMSNRDASSRQRRGRFLNTFATIAEAAVGGTLWPARSASKAGWRALARHPVTTEPIERTSAVPDELADEQAAFAKRFRTRRTDSEPQAADRS